MRDFLMAVSETEGGDTLEALQNIEPGLLEKWFTESFLPALVEKALAVVVALLVFVVGKKLLKLLVRLVDRAMERMHTEVTLRKFFRTLITTCWYVFLGIAVFVILGAQLSAFMTVISSIGIALGLALQGSLSNFAGGILILVMHPFRVGDYIVTGTNEGTVKNIGLVYTELLTADNRSIFIPNGTLANSTMTNATSQNKRRVDIVVGISYESDLKLAKELAWQVMNQHGSMLPDEDKSVFVSELAATSVASGSG